ncbi:MAG: cyclic pyranopterin monophosphate synthase MoaC [Phycisphaerae bacterium]
MTKLTHIDAQGAARMVNVGNKQATQRSAKAEAILHVHERVMAAIRANDTPKGNVLETARLAGIMAAKRTDALIPLCHTLPLHHVSVDFELLDCSIRVIAFAETHAPTGVEMEALVAASIAGLTLYDMLKALQKDMTLASVRLLEKKGGTSGDDVPPQPASAPT